MSVFDDIRELKSSNDFEGAWQTGYKALQFDKNNEYLRTSLFWVIYAALKTLMVPIKSRENTAPRPSEQQEIDLWVSRIPSLELSLPNENIDFRLWNLFTKTGKFCEPICLYILQSGRNIFTPEDHKPYISDKGESPSIVQKLARMVAACYLLNPEKSALSAPRIVALINYAEDTAEDSAAGKIWLAYDKAKIFIQAGKTDRARQSFLVVLKRKRSESWAWFGLADTYPHEPNIAIKLLASGLMCSHEPKFIVRGFFKIAVRLAELGAYEDASKALRKLMEVYERNGWPPKDNIVNLMSSSWYDASIDISDFDSIIRNLAEDADRYIIDKPQHYLGILQNVHGSEKGANIYVSRDLTLSARISLFPNRRLPEPGTPLKVLCDLSSDKPEVFKVAPGENFDSPDIRFFDGTLRITEKGFGFVNSDVFVQASLAAKFPTNSETTGVAVASFDKAKNRYGWKAITLRRKDC
ncbi:tetratricopeptide repeat protein [Halomonas halodenitrificans]|uniref:tetratricopeptide repeat protein n=1 Tax=Halomonas halodenitrificans TaxID=28252 RepID=UPI000A074C2D|nr:hypothetical protein [Halomonas halodenitrificans]